MDKANQFSQVFATQYQEKMRDANCLDEDNSLIIERMKLAFANKSLDIAPLSLAISGQD